MNIRSLTARAAVASAALAAGAIALASPASAAFAEYDDVLIDEVGYDIGGDGFTDGSPDEPATLTWSHEWFGVFPELNGKFHFQGVERCARVQLISYDETGAEMSPRDYSDTECPGDLGHNARVIVDEDGSGDLGGRANAAQVKVTLQTQNADLSWSNAGSQTVAYGPVLDTDEVQIFRADADLGSGDFDPPSPEGPATVTWNSTGGPINPVLRGSMYVKDRKDLCFRTKVTYKDDDGNRLEPPRTGTEHCLTDDELHIIPVLMNAFFHNEVAEITYAIEKRGGTGIWETVGQATVELGDGHILNPQLQTLS